MNNKTLFFLVEGWDDQRFIERIIEPLFSNKYLYIKYYQYAQKSTKEIINFIKNIRLINSDYIFLTDLDLKPCVTEKKDIIKTRIKNIDKKNIIIVKKVIEGWYLAGIENTNSKKLKVPVIQFTDQIGKQDFNHYIDDNFFDSRIDFLQEVLKSFSIQTAINRNSSLKYFINKYSLLDDIKKITNF